MISTDPLEPSEAIRRMLVERCRSRRTRTRLFSVLRPVDWRPTELRNPDAPDTYFDDDAAWEFIARRLEAQAPLHARYLDQPPGSIGYELILPGASPSEAIYIKLQLLSDRVLARSFHLSKPDR